MTPIGALHVERIGDAVLWYVFRIVFQASLFSREEQHFLYSLRSQSHAANLNYRKMHSINPKCSFWCQSTEDQHHIFQQWAMGNLIQLMKFMKIFVYKKVTLSKFLMIENQRLEFIKKSQKNKKH